MDNLKEKLEFLAKDEEEAIAGYDKIIAELGNSPIVEQLKKIRDEEEAHLNFLNEAKENPDLEYEDPAHEAEKVEVVGEEDENNDEKEREQASILFKINL